MTAVLRFLGRIALFLWVMAVVLSTIVGPLYLLAIFPRLPEGPTGRLLGISLSSPALLNFWYRLAFCGLGVALGIAIIFATLRALGAKSRAPNRNSAA
jgi:hypothetical protein